MRLAIETGTDAGSVCCFDPAALPPDFDQLCKEDSVETIEQLAKEGRFWWKGDGDGDYLIHFYVNEEVPPEILAVTKDLEEVPRFHVPGGKLVACGVEYAASDPFTGSDVTPKGGLGRFAHMGGSKEIPAGDYSFKAWSCEWPEDAFDQRMAAQFGPDGLRQHRRGTLLEKLIVLPFFLGLLAVVLATYFETPRSFLGLRGLSICWLLIVLFGACLSRLISSVNPPAFLTRKKEIEMQMPAFVIQLRSIAP